MTAVSSGVAKWLGVPDLQRFPQSLNIGDVNFLGQVINSEVIATFRQLTELAIGEISKPDWRDFAVTGLTAVTSSYINAVRNKTDEFTAAAKEFARDEVGAAITAGVYRQKFNAVSAGAVAMGNVAANVTYDQMTKMVRPDDLETSKMKAAANAAVISAVGSVGAANTRISATKSTSQTTKTAPSKATSREANDLGDVSVDSSLNNIALAPIKSPELTFSDTYYQSDLKGFDEAANMQLPATNDPSFLSTVGKIIYSDYFANISWQGIKDAMLNSKLEILNQALSIGEFAATPWSQRPALALSMAAQAFNEATDNIIPDIANRMKATTPAEKQSADAQLLVDGIGMSVKVISGFALSRFTLFSKSAGVSDGMASGVANNVGLTTRLNRTQIKDYLNNIQNISRDQLIKDIESLGLELKGEAPNGLFKTYQDKYGNLRVKIHPPDSSTDYSHIHIYDKAGNSLTKDLVKAPYDVPDVHIEINSIQNELDWRPQCKP